MGNYMGTGENQCADGLHVEADTVILCGNTECEHLICKGCQQELEEALVCIECKVLL